MVHKHTRVDGSGTDLGDVGDFKVNLFLSREGISAGCEGDEEHRMFPTSAAAGRYPTGARDPERVYTEILLYT